MPSNNAAKIENSDGFTPTPKDQLDVNAEVAAEHGINAEEYQRILDILGRTPNYTELGIFSVMWSEHCSYKSSRHYLAMLPTKAPWVIQGPGENAGVIDIGDNQAAIFKMESHNHPSYIEPFQGAATGVGGILRDVFTMGARPIANINALRFGAIDHPKTKSLLSGVVAGIAHYGNCMGIPTVGGETNFHKAYNNNILVNAMTVGLADQDKIFYSRGAQPNQPVVYIGAKTGKDGIHGATMASAEFDDNSAENRPTVQVGDPFVEKLLLEACLELMQQDAIIAIQDMGAAGLTSSSVEIADKGGIGVDLDLDKVPLREKNMVPYEIMLSESQERMLIILKPGAEDLAKSIMDKWDIDFAVIGKTTDTKHLRLSMYGHKWCDIPVPPLVDDAPKYVRPHVETPKQKAVKEERYKLPNGGYAEALKTILSSPDICSKRWIWEQYDTMVRGETLARPSAADGGIVRIPNSKKALVISSDCTPRYCFADPVEGGKQAVAESWRNIVACGGAPLAITDNMNFGNPERPEIMGQFVGAIEGMRDACLALDYPVISGNVSLYNETNGQGILPTPTIGGVGLLKDYSKRLTQSFKKDGNSIYVVGGDSFSLDQSIFAREICDIEEGPAPKVNLIKERKNGGFILSANQNDLISACHDISDGGLLTALAEMAIASMENERHMPLGVKLNDNVMNLKLAFWFGEDQGRYVVTTSKPALFEEHAKEHEIDIRHIGLVKENEFMHPDGAVTDLRSLKKAHEKTIPDLMKG
jgi:phosphoribosylformylglycinamidine synthase